jgi:hypothetical protein
MLPMINFDFLNPLDRFIEYMNQILPKTGHGPEQVPKRTVMEEKLISRSPDIYLFTLEALYQNLSLREDFYVRERKGVAEIALFQIGPS